MRLGLFVSMAFAVTMHAAWLAHASGPSPRLPVPTSDSIRPTSAVGRPLAVRKVQRVVPVPAAMPEVVSAEVPMPAPPRRTGQTADAATIASATSDTELKPEAESPPVASGGPACDRASGDSPGPVGGEPAAQDDPGYLRNAELSRPAEPDGAIPLEFPDFDFDGDAMSYVVTLSLFIDEEGIVQRVRIDDPGLPEALEGAARRAFLATRFRPGRVGDRPVRSLMRVEVRFDREALPR